MLIKSLLEGGFSLHTHHSRDSFVVNSITTNSSSVTFSSEMEENISNETNLTSEMDVKMESEMELPWYGYAICITTMLFIWVVGSVGNFLVIYVVCKEKQLQTPINMFLVNLSVADFFTSAFGSPFPLVASIFHTWPFGETMCIIYAFGMSLGGITSITTLMVLSFERYLMIARPFRAADIRMYHSSAIILCIWFYSLALTLPPLFGWSTYGPEGPYISCSVSWEKDDLATKTYICFLFILGLVIPLITTIFSYAGIVVTIKSTSQAQTCSRTATGKAELRVTAMVAIMVTCFCIAWLPYAAVSLIVSFGGPRQRQLITPIVSVLPAIFAKSATCYNPIIYVGLNTQFQNAWMKVFGIKRDDAETHTGVTVSIGGATSVAPSKSATLFRGNNSVCEEVINPKIANSTTQENVVLTTDVEAHTDKSTNNDDAENQSNEGVDCNEKAPTEIELLPLARSPDEEEQPQGNDNKIHVVVTNEEERKELNTIGGEKEPETGVHDGTKACESNKMEKQE